MNELSRREPVTTVRPSAWQDVTRAAIVLLVLGTGVGGCVALIMTKKEPEKKAANTAGTLVQVAEVKTGRQQVVVVAQGTVVPARSMVVQPEVAGRVRWKNTELLPGGKLLAGDRLVRIDQRDYQLALQQQQAAVDAAKLKLQLERGNKAVAEREFEILGEAPPEDEAARKLAMREPHLQTARAQVAAAQSGAERARLSVNRTVVISPFNAMVQKNSVEVGQLVTPQVPLATLVGTDEFWVQVSVPVEKLSWIRVPGLNAKQGAKVNVVQEIGGRTIEREGRVIRMMGELDPLGRMARLLVEIKDPLGLESLKQSDEQDDEQPGLPLLLGAYVTATIIGSELDDVIELPRSALREDNKVFVMSSKTELYFAVLRYFLRVSLGVADQLVMNMASFHLRPRPLEVRKVDVLWRREKTVLLRKGLVTGDRVVTTGLATPIEGMLLRLPRDKPKKKPRPRPDKKTGKKSKPHAAAAGKGTNAP